MKNVIKQTAVALFFSVCTISGLRAADKGELTITVDSIRNN